MMGFMEPGVWQPLLLRLLLAVAAASCGALVAVSFKSVNHEALCVLISFAAGALLVVAVFDIFPEAIRSVGWVGGVLSILSGYALFSLLTRFVFHICPACAATHTELNFKTVTAAMIVALSVHSFMDGLAIGSSTLRFSELGILVFCAVVYHKLPEGLALAFVARGSGMGRPAAFGLTFSLEVVTTLAGGAAGLLVLVSEHSRWMGYVLGHVGGGFAYLVVHALLSEVIRHHPRTTILAAAAGALSIGLAGFWIGAF